jgi:hypothetical protein
MLKLATHLLQVPMLEWVELYLYFHMRFHDVRNYMLGQLQFFVFADIELLQ